MRTPQLLVVSLLVSLFAASGPLTAQGVFPGEEFTTGYPTGNGPVDIRTADFNADGIPDVATVAYKGNSLILLLGSGTGGFLAPVAYATGNSPAGLAAGDVNNNGTIDVVVANQGSNNVSVFLGLGGGALAAGVLYSCGSAPEAVALADFNLDARLDIATANIGTNGVSRLLNIGGGTFGPFSSYATQTGPVALAAGDLNGDGRPDLAVANQSSSSVSVLLGSAALGFNPAVNYPTGAGPHDIQVFDFSGDGKLDVATANLTAVSISLLLGQGNGTLGSASSIATAFAPYTMSRGDLDGDGKADLVITLPKVLQFGVLMANGPGTFAPIATHPTGADGSSGVLADFDLDGRLDFVTANFNNNTVSIFRGKPGGALASGAFYGGTLAGSRSVVVADFDGDANPDFVLQSDAWFPLLLGFGDGAGGFAAPISLALNPSANVVKAADMNLDGILDIVTGNSGAMSIGIALGIGGGSFAAPVDVTTTTGVQTIAVADANQDGIPDLIDVQISPSTANLWFGGGGLTFGSTPSQALPGTPIALAMGDVSFDGLPDALVMTAASQISALTMTPTGLAPQFVFGPTPDGHNLAVGDFDLDGSDDVVASIGNTIGYARVWLSSGLYASSVDYPDGLTGNDGIAVADLDHDGRLDLAIASHTGPGWPNAIGAVAVMKGTVAATFNLAGMYGSGPVGLDVVANDLDGNGFADVLVVNNGGGISPAQPLMVLLNQGADAAGLAHFGHGTPGCFGKLGLGTNVAPVIGTPAFSFTCTNAPASTLGVVLVGNQADFAGSDPISLGIGFHIDLFNSTLLLGIDCFSDAGGTSITPPGPIPANAALIGSVFVAQALWLQSSGAACGPSPFHLVSSEGLLVTVQ